MTKQTCPADARVDQLHAVIKAYPLHSGRLLRSILLVAGGKDVGSGMFDRV